MREMKEGGEEETGNEDGGCGGGGGGGGGVGVVRVLVVDDSPVDRKVVEMLLKKSGGMFEGKMRWSMFHGDLIFLLFS